MATFIDLTAHGLTTDDAIYFSNVSPSYTGLEEGATFYVLAAGLTADTFQFSETIGGAPYDFDPVDEATVNTVEEWAVLDDDEMTPPEAPAAPTSLVLSSASELDADGHAIARLDISLVQPTSATLRHSVVTITPATGDPIKVIIPVGQTTASVHGVKAGILYTAVAYAYDTFGLVSVASNTDTETPTGDTTAPAQVTGAAAFGAILGVIASWTGSSSTDLSHYEVDIDDNSGFTSPDTYKLKGTVISLTQLAVGTWYLRVRAMDQSGNAGAYSSTVSAASRTVATADLTDALITTAKLVAGSVTDVELAAAAVTAAKIAVDAVTAAAIAAGAVGTSELDANAVTTAKLAALAVTSTELAASAVTTAKIAADAVTASEIATGAVGSTELAAGAVIAGKITAGTIVAADIAAGTITGAKIAAGTITASNIAADTITANEIAASAITASEIDALAVTTAKLAAGAVTAAKITAGTITTTEIAALTIVAANIAAGTITAAKIAAGTITATEIAALTIVAANIAAGTITGAKIAAGTITASNIAADTITANEIAALAIGTSELAAGAVTAAKITAGTITATEIAALTITAAQLAAGSVTASKLSIQDAYGATVLDANGFGGSWLDFLASGLIYNSAYKSGDTSDIAVTEVGSSATLADYLAGAIQSHLPYWVVSASGGVLKNVTDTHFKIGTALESSSSGAQTNRWFQDVPVTGLNPEWRLNFERKIAYIPTGQTVTLNVYASFRKADHSLASGSSRDLILAQAFAASDYEKSGTANAGTDLVHSVAHGFQIGDGVIFTSLTGGTGLVVGTQYYVIASGWGADDFKVSTTVGGSNVDITFNYTSLKVAPFPQFTYDAIAIEPSTDGTFGTFLRIEYEVVHSGSGSLFRVGDTALGADINVENIFASNVSVNPSISTVTLATQVVQMTDGTCDFGNLTAMPTLRPNGTGGGGVAAGDRCYRTDLNLEFVYNGTRWLSTELFTTQYVFNNGTAISATTALIVIPTPPLQGCADVWLVDSDDEVFITGGTALSASHKWVGVLASRSVTNAATTIVTDTVDSGTLSNWLPKHTDIDALQNNGTTKYALVMTWTKTGTPGTLQSVHTLSYRLVGT